MIPTLGLYWPFAAVAVWRKKLQAVMLTLEALLEHLIAMPAEPISESAGEMAADLAESGLGW